MALQTAAIRTPSDGSYTLVSNDPRRYPNIPVKTIHLSCASDTYEGSWKNYAGFVLYAYGKDYQTQWELNGRRCRTGYVVIQDTDSSAVQRYIASSPGIVHGAVYKNVFDDDLGNVIGEGFSVMKGEFKGTSGTFNVPTTTVSPYHDGLREISWASQEVLSRVINMWKSAGENNHGLPSCRNYGFSVHRDDSAYFCESCSVWCEY